MAVQMRVQCPRSLVLKYRCHDVAGEPVSAFPFFANPCRGERLQLAQRFIHCLLMRFDYPGIIAHQCGDGYRLGR